MKALAWDTSTKSGTICAFEFESNSKLPRILKDWNLNVEVVHSEQLLWGIDETLKEVGLEDGFTITMDTRNTEPVTSMALAIQSTFAMAGIELEIIPGEGKQTLTKYRARNHDIYIGRWGPDYMDPHTNADTFARNPNNADDAKSKPLAWRNAWDIPEMTKKADAAVLENDAKKRADMYIELQREHQQVSPFVIMFQDIEILGKRANVDGFILGPSFDSNFYYNTTK